MLTVLSRKTAEFHLCVLLLKIRVKQTPTMCFILSTLKLFDCPTEEY